MLGLTNGTKISKKMRFFFKTKLCFFSQIVEKHPNIPRPTSSAKTTAFYSAKIIVFYCKFLKGSGDH